MGDRNKILNVPVYTSWDIRQTKFENGGFLFNTLYKRVPSILFNYIFFIIECVKKFRL